MTATVKWAILAFLIGSLGGYLTLYVLKPVFAPELEDLRVRCEQGQGEGHFRSFDAESCNRYSTMLLGHSRTSAIYGLGLGLLAALGVVTVGILRRGKEEDETWQEESPSETPTRIFDRAPDSSPVSRRMTPIDIYSDPNASGRVRVEDRSESLKHRDGFGRERWAEPQLLERIKNEPNNLAARTDLLDIYIEENRTQEAARVARELVRGLVAVNELNRAYDVFRQVRKKLGHLELGVKSLAGLLDLRLSMRDADGSLDLFENLYGQDPNFNRIPELMAGLVRLLAAQKGANDASTRNWYAELVRRFAGTREAEDLITEFGQEGDAGTGISPDAIRTMIANHQYTQAINTLMAETQLVSQIGLMELYPIAQRLSQDRNLLPKAVMLMELMVRGHLEDPGAPALALDLIEIYLTRLNQRQRAERWGGYLLSRWPRSQEAARVREILPDITETA